MDAARLDMGAVLPHAFLTAAAPGYLTESEWEGLDDDWLEQALAYAAADCKGVRGPLAPVRPRALAPTPLAARATWRLADYLEQHGRSSRQDIIPPAEFWAAAAENCDLRGLENLARAARKYGLLRAAAGLYKRAAAHGHAGAVTALVEELVCCTQLTKGPPDGAQRVSSCVTLLKSLRR